MTRLLLLFCVSFLVIHLVNGQQMDTAIIKSTQGLNANYRQKYQTNKTAGWVLLGSGIGMIIGGGAVFAAYAHQGFNGPAPVTGEAFLFIIGPGAALASIPFFIVAKHNKTKAELVIKGEPVTFGNPIFSKSNYTALALTIKF